MYAAEFLMEHSHAQWRFVRLLREQRDFCLFPVVSSATLRCKSAWVHTHLPQWAAESTDRHWSWTWPQWKGSVEIDLPLAYEFSHVYMFKPVYDVCVCVCIFVCTKKKRELFFREGLEDLRNPLQPEWRESPVLVLCLYQFNMSQTDSHRSPLSALVMS